MYGSARKSGRPDKRKAVTVEIEDETCWSESASAEVNRKWWDFMADIMETNKDSSPVCCDLIPVFHLD